MKISGDKRHRFVCIDTAVNKILWVDENGEIYREIPDTHAAFEIWNLPGDKILFPHFGGGSDGFSILNPDGSIAMRYKTHSEIFSCQPLENGNVLVGELGPKRLVEVDPDGNIVIEVKIPYEGIPHECLRAVRKVGDEYLAVQPGLNKIRKFSANGEILQEYNIHGDAFGVVAMPDGNIVYACMSGAYELDKDGHEIWSLTNEDVPEMNIRWLLGVQLLSDGNLVFANWMGHGHLDEGIHFFEVNREKKVVWSCDGRGILKTPATIQILDEDPSKVCFTPLK